MMDVTMQASLRIVTRSLKITAVMASMNTGERLRSTAASDSVTTSTE